MPEPGQEPYWANYDAWDLEAASAGQANEMSLWPKGSSQYWEAYHMMNEFEQLAKRKRQAPLTPGQAVIFQHTLERIKGEGLQGLDHDDVIRRAEREARKWSV